uniref:adipocyte plasma membrane-associated protein-like n=1 Tax=Styela clava TaxID=7725 RepID=UPI0019399DEB|nr:adipocyte plasma membrane-associated protein-like [Styela clava]
MTGGYVVNRMFLFVPIGIGLLVGSVLTIAYVRSPFSALPVNDTQGMDDFDWVNLKNKDLQRGRKIVSELIGPESIAVDEHDNLYTGLRDGRIMKIINPGKVNQTVIDLTKSFDFAEGSKRKKKRPLGLRLHGSKLYFADAYQGIIMIESESRTYDIIVSYNDVNPPLVFPDDLTMTSDGKTIYFTDVSLKWGYDDIIFSVLEAECTGRLFKVDVLTKNTELILDSLCISNGIEIVENDTHVLLSEHSRRRLALVNLESKEVVRYIALPAGPDNIRKRKNGGYWVGMPYIAEPGHFATWGPVFRQILAGALGSDGALTMLNIDQGVAVKLNENFEPESIHLDLEGKLSQAVTEISELSDGTLLIGSFMANGIVLIDPLSSD